jgi:hypothetical protein
MATKKTSDKIGALQVMQQRIEGMNDEALADLCEILPYYSPGEYYDESGLIRVSSFAAAVKSQMRARKLALPQ